MADSADKRQRERKRREKKKEKVQLKSTGKARVVGNIFHNPSMPSLDELRGTIVGLINAPATKVAQVVNAPAAKLARVFGAYGAKEAA